MVSIVIPVYNVEKYLRKCLDSVCAQGEVVSEILLVNDGSTDGSGAICEEFAKKDLRIRIITQENAGLAAAVRVGVRAATGKYIGFVDSDDYIEPEMFTQMAAALEESGADMAACDYDRVDEDGNFLACTPLGIDDSGVYEKKGNAFPFQILPSVRKGKFVYFSGSRCNKLLPKKLLVESFSFEDRGINMCEDTALITPIIMKCNKIVYIKRTFYHYIQRRGSISKDYKPSYLEDWRNLMAVYKQGLEESGYLWEDISGLAVACLFATCLHRIRISGMTHREKKEAFRTIAKDEEVKDCLRQAKGRFHWKHGAFLFGLKHGLYGLIAHF